MASRDSLEVAEALRAIRARLEVAECSSEPGDGDKDGNMEARESSCASTATPSTSMHSTTRSEELAQLQGPGHETSVCAAARRFERMKCSEAAVGMDDHEAHPSPDLKGGPLVPALLLPPCGSEFSDEGLHEGSGKHKSQTAKPALLSWRETDTYTKLRQWVRKDTEDRESLVEMLDESINTSQDSGVAAAPADISVGIDWPVADDDSTALGLLLPPCLQELSRVRQDGGNRRASELLDDGRDISPIRARPILART